jgi:hypothetical protein
MVARRICRGLLSELVGFSTFEVGELLGQVGLVGELGLDGQVVGGGIFGGAGLLRFRHVIL